jgi:alkylation response protein AidB-like acyl-CoA dehydrogenase
MKFGLDQDQVQFSGHVRKFLAVHMPIEQVRTWSEAGTGCPPEVWQRMTQELGLGAIGFPEEVGGTGDRLLDQIVVAAELGRVLDPSPYFPSIVVVARTVLEAEPESKWLVELLEGTTTASPAMLDPADPTMPTPDGAWASRGDEGWRVTGGRAYVPQGSHVDSFLVLAGSEAGPTLLRVDREATGVSLTDLPTLDLTRPVSQLDLHDVPAELVGEPGGGLAPVYAALNRALVLMAADLSGGARAVLELTTAYAKERCQFDRPIASFQSIKHMLADVLLELEAARSAFLYAAPVLDSGEQEARMLGHLCQAVASEAYVKATRTAIQVHGAIGFTWEHDLHLYFKRATSGAQVLGSPQFHRERIAAALLDA